MGTGPAGADTDNMMAPRTRFQGVLGVISFNWPYYAFAVGLIVAGILLANRIPSVIAIPVRIAMFLAAFWAIASILVTYHVYDRSELYRWTWLEPLLQSHPKKWANFHAGLDESSDALRSLFPGSKSTVFDIYDSSEMTEPSIERARQNSLGVADTRISAGAIPLEADALDAAFVLFAAHEFRNELSRARFFNELARVLARHGRLILVEHLRDAANFVAYGPAFRHFYPRNEWVRVATAAGLTIRAERSITKFVRCFVMAKGPI
jgi:SAM-dependent methyltransferase